MVGLDLCLHNIGFPTSCFSCHSLMNQTNASLNPGRQKEHLTLTLAWGSTESIAFHGSIVGFISIFPTLGGGILPADFSSHKMRSHQNH